MDLERICFYQILKVIINKPFLKTKLRIRKLESGQIFEYYASGKNLVQLL